MVYASFAFLGSLPFYFVDMVTFLIGLFIFLTFLTLSIISYVYMNYFSIRLGGKAPFPDFKPLSGFIFLIIVLLLYYFMDQIFNLVLSNEFAHVPSAKFAVFSIPMFTAFIFSYPVIFEEKVISPLRAMLTSLIAIVIISLLQPQAALSFIPDLKHVGLPLLGIVLLNLFADSLSLIETRIVLRMAITGSIAKFHILLLVDIFASAFIFLIIPFSTGNIQIFLDAIFFSGDRPWV